MTWQWAHCSSFPNHFLQSHLPPVSLLPKAGAGQGLGESLSNPPCKILQTEHEPLTTALTQRSQQFSYTSSCPPIQAVTPQTGYKKIEGHCIRAWLKTRQMASTAFPHPQIQSQNIQSRKGPTRITEVRLPALHSPWAVGSLGAKGKALLGCKSDCQETATEAPSHRSHLEVTKSKLNFRVTKAEQQHRVPQDITNPTSKQQNPKKTSLPEKPACINNSQTVKKKAKQGTSHFPRLPEMEGKDNNNKVNSHPNKQKMSKNFIFPILTKITWCNNWYISKIK